ncbi:MAG: alanine--tRNA ligase-related protein [Hymenobacter sp.]
MPATTWAPIPKRRTCGGSTPPTTASCPATRRTTSGRWATPAPAARAPKSTSTCARTKSAPPNPGRELVNADHPQVVEVWNNVFMEFQRLADKSLLTLPAQSVDTGMGFERLMMAVSGVKSNYDTDVFQPLIQFIAQEAGVAYHGTSPATVTDLPTTEDEKTDIAIRVIADHIRAIAFTIADGQLPSNVKAGYVIRRILRRAVRYAFSSPESEAALPLQARAGAGRPDGRHLPRAESPAGIRDAGD